MNTKLTLMAGLIAAAALGACTGHNDDATKTGSGELTPPVAAPTGQTDTSAPGATVPSAATPAPATGGTPASAPSSTH